MLIVYMIAMLGAILAMIAMVPGIALTYDSMVYLKIAMHIPDSMTPIHFAPLLPAVMAGFKSIGLNILSSLSILNALLFAVTIIITANIVNKYTQSIRLSALSAFLIMTSIDMLKIFSSALSEPLFIVSLLLSVMFLISYLENGRYIFLCSSAFMMMAAYLSRYAAVAFIAAAVVSIMLLSVEKQQKRFLDIVVFILISCIPTSFWLYFGYTHYGSLANRSMVIHWIDFEHIKAIPYTVSAWILPDMTSKPLRILFLICLLSLIVVDFKKIQSVFSNLFAKVLAVFSLFYLLFLAISVSFFDFHTSLDYRILAPVFIFVVIVLIAANKDRKVPKEVIFLFCIMLSLRSGFWVIDTLYNGQACTSRMWKESSTMKGVYALPKGTVIYTNQPDVIFHLTGENAIMLPKKIDPQSNKVNRLYMEQISKMRYDLKASGGVLVYFNTTRDYLPSFEDLSKQAGFNIVFQGDDGKICSIS